MKDKSGRLIIPTATSSTTNSSMEELVAQNLKIQNDMFILQNKYRDAIDNYEKASDERDRQQLSAENAQRDY